MSTARFDELVDMNDTKEVTPPKPGNQIDVPASKEAKGKTLVGKVNNYGLIELVDKAGKELPDALKGSFTSMMEAESTVNAWLAKNPKKSAEVVHEVKRNEVAQEAKFNDLTKGA